MQVTAIIGSKGRPTLTAAVESALREGMAVSVASAHPSAKLQCADLPVTYTHLGEEFGLYGSVGFNVAAFTAPTPWVAVLGDDDVFVRGAGAAIATAVESDDADVWIPGLRYGTGATYCLGGAVVLGNVTHPIMRRTTMAVAPLGRYLVHDPEQLHGIDYHQIRRLDEMGYRVAWIGSVCVLSPNGRSHGQ